MEFDFVEWDAEDDPRGNVRHIADNGLSVDEVEDVIYDPQSRQVQSRSSKRPALIGRTSSGKTVIVIYERHKDGGIIVIRPVSAFEIVVPHGYGRADGDRPRDDQQAGDGQDSEPDDRYTEDFSTVTIWPTSISSVSSSGAPQDATSGAWFSTAGKASPGRSTTTAARYTSPTALAGMMWHVDRWRHSGDSGMRCKTPINSASAPRAASACCND